MIRKKREQKFKNCIVGGRILFLSLLLFSPKIFSAPAVTDRFDEANQRYHDGKYAEAVQVYEEIIKSNPQPVVYYNLGNAYFKARKPGLAILNYKRALALAPRDRDIRQNLGFASQLIEYKIEDKRSWYVRKLDKLLTRVTLMECWSVALGGYFIFTFGLFISLILNRRPIFGRSGALALVFVLFCSFPLLLKYGVLGGGRPAVVIEPQAEVRYGPSTTDSIAFRLVEGLEVSLQGEERDWCRIQLTDGRSGWLPKSQVVAV